MGGGPFIGEMGQGGGVALAGLFDGDIIPLQRLPPQYPRDAARNRIQGWVQLEVQVNADGSVRGARVMDAKPKGLFEASAVAAVLKWKFKPRAVNGQPVAQRGMQKIEFNLTGADEHGVQTSGTRRVVVGNGDAGCIRCARGLHGATQGGRLDERGHLSRGGRSDEAHRRQTSIPRRSRSSRSSTESGNDYEKAIVFYNLGYASASKNDQGNAVKAFAQALSLSSMPQQQHEQLQYNLGQLYIVAGQPEDGIRTLQQYVAEACNPVPAEAHIYLANALSTRKRFKEALPQIDLALSKAKAPKESWLQLKLAIHYELKDFKGCAQTLVQLVGVAPAKPDYWKQLAAIFMEMKSGHRGARRTGAGGAAGIHRQTERAQKPVQRVHDARSALQGRSAHAGLDGQGQAPCR